MNKLGKKNNWSAYLYITPLMIFSFVLVYYCIIRTVVVSFTDWDGMSDVFQFIGLKNYRKMLADPVFWKSVTNNRNCLSRLMNKNPVFSRVLEVVGSGKKR